QERYVFIGRGIFKVLRQVIMEADQTEEKKQHPAALPLLQEAPPVIHEAHGLLLYDIAVIVGAIYQQVIEPTQAGRVPKRLANKIWPLLHGHRHASTYQNDDFYLDMVCDIALHLGLLRLAESTGQKARYMPGPQLSAWSQMQIHEQVRLLLDLWWNPRNDFWSDVAGAQYRPDGYSYYMDMRSARKTLLEYVAQECRPGQWYTLESFLRTIKERDPLLLRTQSRYSSYGNTGHIRKTILANWEQGDSQLIAGMLASSLYELGLVTTGYLTDPSLNGAHEEPPGNAYAFKLTELAAAVFAPGDMAMPEEARPTLIVQPNFELLLLHPDFPTLYQLLPFVKVNQIEMVSRLTLTQESVRRGVEAGWNVERSLQTLREHSQKDLPQNVLYTMQD
ncbi:MAG: helicase-associated domain-containing protein, partial [Ktedonobacteraceae bacterium]